MSNFYKIMFFISMTMGTFISISSYSWMGMWMGLEINLLSFIPLISTTKNAFSTEAAMKYFITQTVTTLLLLFTVIIMSTSMIYNISMNKFMIMILHTSLFTKMGAAPFHFWLPEVMEGLNWINSLIMITWQKITPFILITYTNPTLTYFSMIVFSSMLISGTMGINQTSLRKILAYSSINHIGWMTAAIMLSKTIWIYYFIIYTLISINIIWMLKTMNIFYMKQLFSILNNNNMLKMFFMINFLSLGGLPPFLGFLPKWMTIQNLIMNNFLLMSMIMTIMTLMTLFFYMRLMLTAILLNMNETSFYKTPNISNNIMLIINFINLMSLIMCTIMFNYT